MNKILVAVALTIFFTPALAQNTGPAPQSGMEKPGTTDGAKPDGSMDTGGTSAANGNAKRKQDGAPGPGKKEYRK